jgi:glyoxylase-like metal-dependent hydrolase (beta-lactamase superfamily II)
MIARTNLRRRGRMAVVVLAGGLATAPVFAQQQTPYIMINAAAVESPVTVKLLRGNVSLLDGSGGNIGVLAGPEGMFMLDAGIAVSQQKIENALRNFGSTPLRYVVNTHWHWDHTDGNAWVHRKGAVIIASPNTAKYLGQTIRVVEWGHTFTPVPADARPTQLVSSDKTMPFEGETIRIRPYISSHTDGDLSVYFEKADVLFTGDTWWNGLYPFIDYVEGGDINGMISAANENVGLAGPNTIVVPGHGTVGGRAELIEYRDMLVAIRDSVGALKSEGRSLEQVIAARPTKPFDAKWGKAIVNPARFTTLVYRGV